MVVASTGLTKLSVCCLCMQPVPALLEIPSKDSPYDPNQDSLLRRVKHLLGMA